MHVELTLYGPEDELIWIEADYSPGSSGVFYEEPPEPETLDLEYVSISGKEVNNVAELEAICPYWDDWVRDAYWDRVWAEENRKAALEEDKADQRKEDKLLGM